MTQIRHGRERTARGTQRGFTLIELMVVITVVGILMAVAVVSYRSVVIKTHRGAAKGCVAEAAQYMERFYTTSMAYDKNAAGVAVTLPANCSTEGGEYYTIGFAAGEPTATTFKIQAVPKANQNDAHCGTLSVDQTGKKFASGPGGVGDCW